MNRLAAMIILVILVSTLYPVPIVAAYSFSNGQITSTNGAITVPIPYIAPPPAGAPSSLLSPIPSICGGQGQTPCPDFFSDALKWFESLAVNFLIDIANALIQVVNMILGFLVELVGGILAIPIYLFDAVSITTLGPVVDFLSFIPPNLAWLAVVAVWAIALTEWTIMIIVIVRLARAVIGGVSGIFSQGEEGVAESAASA